MTQRKYPDHGFRIRPSNLKLTHPHAAQLRDTIFRMYWELGHDLISPGMPIASMAVEKDREPIVHPRTGQRTVIVIEQIELALCADLRSTMIVPTYTKLQQLRDVEFQVKDLGKPAYLPMEELVEFVTGFKLIHGDSPFRGDHDNESLPIGTALETVMRHLKSLDKICVGLISGESAPHFHNNFCSDKLSFELLLKDDTLDDDILPTLWASFKFMSPMLVAQHMHKHLE